MELRTIFETGMTLLLPKRRVRVDVPKRVIVLVINANPKDAVDSTCLKVEHNEPIFNLGADVYPRLEGTASAAHYDRYKGAIVFESTHFESRSDRDDCVDCNRPACDRRLLVDAGFDPIDLGLDFGRAVHSKPPPPIEFMLHNFSQWLVGLLFPPLGLVPYSPGLDLLGGLRFNSSGEFGDTHDLCSPIGPVDFSFPEVDTLARTFAVLAINVAAILQVTEPFLFLRGLACHVIPEYVNEVQGKLFGCYSPCEVASRVSAFFSCSRVPRAWEQSNLTWQVARSRPAGGTYCVAAGIKPKAK